ncbi:MAG: DUF2628 domain-containing protein [Ruminococcus flavefaciens]|nr:DUF2628 domain-containing protein [Ruminococcus flavefaciens]MCM1228553.1 DUF2628 domain-containing protein [Ruminococcus flavefaciens]
MNYTGAKCVSCGKDFTESDDIVVCPDCGSPHHRECYKAQGICANISRHAEKFNWNQANSVVGKINNVADSDSYPDGEGIHVEKIEVSTIPEFIDSNIKLLDKNQKDGCSLREVLDFVHSNVLYYMPVFARIRNMGVNMSFNLICFIFPQIYFANRRMWFWAILTSVLSVLLMIPVMISVMAENSIFDPNFQSTYDVISSHAGLINSLMDIGSGADLLMRVLLCLFGNRLYYNFAVKSIRRMKSGENGDITEKLKRKGGTKPLNIILIVIIMFAMNLLTMLILQYLLPIIF